MLRNPATYGLTSVDRIVFPATTAAHLAHSWPSSVVRLIAPTAALVPVEDLTAGDGCCFGTVISAARENTYFTRPADADALRDAAYAATRLPLTRDTCQPLTACYLQRSEGVLGGRWEGGARVVVNRGHLLQTLQRSLQVAAPGGRMRLVTVNSSHSFAQQVLPWPESACLFTLARAQARLSGASFTRPSHPPFPTVSQRALSLSHPQPGAPASQPSLAAQPGYSTPGVSPGPRRPTCAIR